MKFINVIKEGDFIKLKSINRLIREGWYHDENCPIIGGEHFTKNYNDLFVSPNTVDELGNIVRIDHVSIGEYNNTVYYACCNSIQYPYDNRSYVEIQPELIDKVLINGKWYDANKTLDCLE